MLIRLNSRVVHISPEYLGNLKEGVVVASSLSIHYICGTKLILDGIEWRIYRTCSRSVPYMPGITATDTFLSWTSPLLGSNYILT